MNYEYAKGLPIKLREAAKDEKWLQDLIAKDPAILGLGDVRLIQRERPQPTGGRIDLILADNDIEEDLRYEVEIMLGAVDESHIIRTIEYWDIERRRYPSLKHRAVIVAEEITNRFFNVVSLLNKAVPILAIQLNAFVLDDRLCLNFVRVLDLVEEEEVEESGEQVDRTYWEKDGRAKSLQVMDGVVALIPATEGKPRVKYNQGHVAVGTSGTNFVWFQPRKGGYVFIELDIGAESRAQAIADLDARGIECKPARWPSTLKMSLTMDELTKNRDVIQTVLAKANEYSKD